MRFVVLFAIAGCYSPAGDCTSAGSTCNPDSGTLLTQSCIGDPAGFLPNTCFTPTVAELSFADVLALDTTADPRCEASRDDACFIVANTIDVSGSLIVKGTRPLVLWAAAQITVSGTINASSGITTKIGPGANPSSCTPILDSIGAGTPFVAPGGGGGGYGGLGGFPGAGLGSVATANNVRGDMEPPALRGGCPGGRSGTTARGEGGGAVYLMAGTSMMITGSIHASGSGGRGGIANASTRDGGGGGGSGGLVGFDAPVITLIDARIVALGGAGGGGAGTTGTMTFAAGGNGGEVAPLTPTSALGGAQSIDTNSGGAGGALDGGVGGNGGGVEVGGEGGGGGGGGGPGYILRFGTGRFEPKGTTEIAPPCLGC